MDIAIVVAVAANGVIGRNNQLPWRLPADMAHFKNLTTGHTVIMGRKTFDSIGRPLPNRRNIVISRDVARNQTRHPGAEWAPSLAAALEMAKTVHKETACFIIGGSAIYAQALPLVTRIVLTEVAATVDGDSYFPPLDQAHWVEESRTVHEADARHAYAFTIRTLVRKSNEREENEHDL